MTKATLDLTHAPVFCRLVAGDRAELARLARRSGYEKGESICRQGDTWTQVAYILSGRVEWAMISPEGKRLAAFELNAGELAWGPSFFDNRPMPASLEVQMPSEIYLWSRDALTPVLSRCPEALWDVSRLLVASMRRARDVVYGFAFHSVAGRVARLLLARYPETEGRPVPRDLTLEEMAAAVGTTPELVCKVLHRFADDGLIGINRMEFAFLNRGELARLASEG